MSETSESMSDQVTTMNTHTTSAEATDSSTRARRSGRSVVQTSIRMSRGTREALNFIRYTLNRHRTKSEPAWSLGEVIELSIDHAYGPWRKIREAVNQNPELKADGNRRRRPRAGSDPVAPADASVAGDRSTAA